MLISVVTVCYNAKDILEETILSVISQTYKELEYIVIDGGSEDGTQSILKKYENHITYYISEPDKGIYDAMNKGVQAAKGDYVLFMNSGDCFYNDTTLEDWVESINNERADVYYGDCVYKYSYGDRYMKALPLKEIGRMMVFSHQSVMVAASILKNKRFDIRYRFAADYDCLLRCFLEGRRFVYSPLPISIVEMDKGATASNFLESKKEVLRIHHSRGYSWCKRSLIFFRMMFTYYWHSILKSMVPSDFIAEIQSKKK
jgi:glycosyltransferase involved in cell wall biosynthesis